MLASSAGKNNGGMSRKTKTNIAVISVVLVLAILVGVVVWDNVSETVAMGGVVAETENFKVTGAMMSYFYASQYNYYQNMYSQYGIDFSTTLTGYDKTVYSSPYEYYMKDQIHPQVEQILIFCEGAKAEGLELTEEDEQEIEESLDAIKEAASSYLAAGYTTSSYIQSMYGQSVTLSVIRDCLKLSFLADNFSEHFNEKLKDAVTEGEINEYFKEHKRDYLESSILTYVLKVSLGSSNSGSASDDDKSDYAAKKDLVKQYVDRFVAAKNADEFKAVMADYILEYMFDDMFVDAYEEEFGKGTATDKEDDEPEEADDGTATAAEKKVPTAEQREMIKEEIKKFVKDNLTVEEPKDFGDSGVTDFKDAVKDIAEDVLEVARTEYESIEVEEYTYLEKEENEKDEDKKDESESTGAVTDAATDAATDAEGTTETTGSSSSSSSSTKLTDNSKYELSDWVYELDANDEVVRKENETFKFEYVDKADGNDTTFAVTVALVTKVPTRNDTPTRDVSHILVKTEDEAKQLLDEFLKSDDQTREGFKKLLEEHNTDSNVEYDEVYEGQMVEEFEEWLFNKDRKEGDTGIVKTEYGYHIMFYAGENMPKWQSSVKTDIVNENYDKWFEEQQKTLNIKFDDTLYKHIYG